MMNLDRVVSIAAALAAPVIVLLVDQHLLSSAVATDVAAIVATAVGAYHVNNDSARAALADAADVAGAPSA